MKSREQIRARIEQILAEHDAPAHSLTAFAGQLQRKAWAAGVTAGRNNFSDASSPARVCRRKQG